MLSLLKAKEYSFETWTLRSTDNYASCAFSSNNVENFWLHLKRGIYDIYHQLCTEHLHRYYSELNLD
ncbi:MAG: transposase [Bacteroidetes bacterium]|nr:transposase [Bacteroidota bacterium]